MFKVPNNLIVNARWIAENAAKEGINNSFFFKQSSCKQQLKSDNINNANL